MDCGGPTSCRNLPKATTKFFYGQEIAGSGTVYPHSTFLEGGTVPNSCYMVRFRHVSNKADLADFLTDCSRKPVLWKKQFMERVILLGDISQEIGSAILVDDRPVPPLVCRGRIGRSATTLDVGKVVIICDVNLDSSKFIRGTKYPYGEWYGIRSLMRFKDMHFADGKVPAVLDDFAGSGIVAALWCEDRIKKRS